MRFKLKYAALTVNAISADGRLVAFANMEEIRVMEIDAGLRINVIRNAPEKIKDSDSYSLRHTGTGFRYAHFLQVRLAVSL